MLQVVWPAHNLWNILANLCFVHSQLFKNTHRLLSAETAAVLLKQTTSFLKSDVCFLIFHTRYTTLRPSELPGRQDWKLKYKILIFLLPLAQWLMFCFYTRSYSCMNNKQNIMNITFNLNIILRYLTTSGYFSEYSGGAELHKLLLIINICHIQPTTLIIIWHLYEPFRLSGLVLQILTELVGFLVLSYRLSAPKNASSPHDNKAETQRAAEGELNTKDETQPARKTPAG